MRDSRGVPKMYCPNGACDNSKSKSRDFVENGLYHHKCGKRGSSQLSKCKKCGRRFSTSSGTVNFRMRKPHINREFIKNYCSDVSLRSSAYLLGVNRRTLASRVVQPDRRYHAWTH